MNNPRSLKLPSLPEDVIVLILAHSLTLWELLAVSHTCRSLRLCITYRSAWAAAWARSTGDRRLPPYPLPTIKRHPQLFGDLARTDTGQSASLFCSFITPMTSFYALDRAQEEDEDTSGEMCGEATRFLKIIQTRHQLRQQKAVFRPITRLTYSSFNLKPDSPRLFAGGNYVLFKNQNRPQILDIRAQVQYDIALTPMSTVGHWDADIVRLENRSGVLLAVP
ncbi:hypothetical protein DL93DRAFT_1613288 [Clavulina sp. PMI_390]|nr:hypothetical protein DL93DRAFT_1613288 [Clavulina sp. PMI_390]